MKPRQCKTIYVFEIEQLWLVLMRPLLALLCLAAGIGAGLWRAAPENRNGQAHVQLSLHPPVTRRPEREFDALSEPCAWEVALPPAASSAPDVSRTSSQSGTEEHDNSGQEALLLPGAKAGEPGLQTASESRSASFVWPVDGEVTDCFGWRTHPITGKRQFHDGIDIAAPLGAAVKAAASGTITFAGWSEGYGRLVVIGHADEYRTKYGHLSRYVVGQGQKVIRGEVIGYVGESGNTTGPHCHFEVVVAGQAIDPKDYLP